MKDFFEVFGVSIIIILFGFLICGGIMFNYNKRNSDHKTIDFINVCLEHGNSLDNCLGAIKDLEK